MLKSRLSNTKVIKSKACLVAKGYSQKKCVDYNEIFFSIVRHTFIHVLLALVATLDMEIEQLDLKTNFLYGKLEEDILMKQLAGLEVQGKKNYL